MRNILVFIFVLFLTIGAIVGFSYKIGLLNSTIQKSTASQNSNKTHTVSLLGNKAEPEILLAKVGDYVQFNSKDGKDHNLAQGSGNATDDTHSHKQAGIESGKFGADEGYKVQFKKVGIYAFHDHYNPDLYIRVIVDDKKD